MTAKRYKEVHDLVLASLPAWKVNVIQEDRAVGNLNSRVMNEFTEQVVRMAEELDAGSGQLQSSKPKKGCKMARKVCEEN